MAHRLPICVQEGNLEAIRITGRRQVKARRRSHPYCDPLACSVSSDIGALRAPLFGSVSGLSGAALEAMHVGHHVHKDPGITLFVRLQGFAAAKKGVRLGDVDLIFSKGTQMLE